ncbi:MAG: hypothetical protein H6739_19265 [Alphaproteobacteria bacterium]|nr:hypothetical protein [Alphaproteobacteria bacterium]
MSSPLTLPQVTLTPDAQRWLDLLRDLGYADDELADALLDALLAAAPVGPEQGPRVIEGAQLRRLAAAALFEREPTMDPAQAETLRREWMALFC